jgi:hypothetical protein
MRVNANAKSIWTKSSVRGESVSSFGQLLIMEDVASNKCDIVMRFSIGSLYFGISVIIYRSGYFIVSRNFSLGLFCYLSR